MRFRVVGPSKFDPELTPTLIFPDARRASITNARIPLEDGSDFRVNVPFDKDGDLQLTFMFPEVKDTWWNEKRDPTEISLKASGPFEQTSEFQVAVINPFRIELQIARNLTKKCLVRCHDGTSGSPCVVCEKNGRSVRFCC